MGSNSDAILVDFQGILQTASKLVFVNESCSDVFVYKAVACKFRSQCCPLGFPQKPSLYFNWVHPIWTHFWSPHQKYHVSIQSEFGRPRIVVKGVSAPDIPGKIVGLEIIHECFAGQGTLERRTNRKAAKLSLSCRKISGRDTRAGGHSSAIDVEVTIQEFLYIIWTDDVIRIGCPGGITQFDFIPLILLEFQTVCLQVFHPSSCVRTLRAKGHGCAVLI